MECKRTRCRRFCLQPKWRLRCIGLSSDFSNGEPVLATGDNTNAPEGSASYSDVNGNLLLYTNGDTVIYYVNDQLMLNMGNSGIIYSAVQSSEIIEAPCEPGKYYQFTMDGVDPTSSNNGLSYFKIEMSLNGGLGGVEKPGGHAQVCNSYDGVHNYRLFVEQFDGEKIERTGNITLKK